MKWVPLLVVLGFLVALLLVNRQIRRRTGHRLLRTNIQGEIFGGFTFFLRNCSGPQLARVHFVRA